MITISYALYAFQCLHRHHDDAGERDMPQYEVYLLGIGVILSYNFRK